MDQWRFLWTSERSVWLHRPDVVLDPSTTGRLARWIKSEEPDLIRAAVPSVSGILIELEVAHGSYPDAQAGIKQRVNAYERAQGPHAHGNVPQDIGEVVIPVCYDPSLAPDLLAVAEEIGCDVQRVIDVHSGARYQVNTMGFMPGFGYLGPLDPMLRVPRKATPRIRVPAGSVAIAEHMTAVYPHQSSGGWHLIGRTPMSLFDPRRPQPARIRVGDWVRFKSISVSAYATLATAHSSMEPER